MQSKISTKLNFTKTLKRHLLLIANIHNYSNFYSNHSSEILVPLDKLEIDKDFEKETERNIDIELRLLYNTHNKPDIRDLLRIEQARFETCINKFRTTFDDLNVDDTDLCIKIDPEKSATVQERELILITSGKITFHCSNDSWKPKSFNGIFRVHSYDIRIENFTDLLVDLIIIRTKRRILMEMLDRITLGQPVFNKHTVDKYPILVNRFLKAGINDVDEIVKQALAFYDFGRIEESTIRKQIKQAYRRLQKAKS